MNTVYFDTPGLLDMRAVTTFGLSVKENDNPIGYFGTGLKYAIAILVRNEADVTITLSNGEHHYFHTKKQTFRDTEFDAIYMNDVEMPFTTELGKNWKMWMAFRELYCNTKDEEGECHIGENGCHAREDVESTLITVISKEFAEVYNNRDHYFIENMQPLMEHESVEVYDRPSRYMFYKGICVGEIQRPAMRTYNATGYMELTEDRTLAYSYNWESAVTTAIAHCNDEEIIRDFVLAPQNSFELHADFSEYLGNQSDAFKRVMKPLASDLSGRVNRSAQALYRKYAEKVGEFFTIVTLSPVQTKMFTKAANVCIDLGHRPDEIEILFVQTLGNGVLGTVIKEKIYISIEVFDMGTKMLAGTLMEELIHHEQKIGDFTRELQNFLVNRIMSLYEDTKGEPL